MLKGEQAHEYVNPQGQRLGVCVLCRSRAEASGWIPPSGRLHDAGAAEPGPTYRRAAKALRASGVASSLSHSGTPG